MAGRNTMTSGRYKERLDFAISPFCMLEKIFSKHGRRVDSPQQSSQIKMSEFDKNGGYSSPMDVVFLMSTPQTGESSGSAKRKSEDDSGYISPCSVKLRPIQSTPYEGSSGFCGDVLTPFAGGGGDAKKRLIISKAPANFDSNVATSESFSDYMDTSLYSEHMELGSSCLDHSQEDCKDSLFSNELSQALDEDFEMSLCEPSTPNYPPPRKVALSTVRRTPKKSKSPKKRLASSAPSQTHFYKKTPVAQKKWPEKINFLELLGVKSYHPSIISRILSYLSDSDLSNVTMVSKTWKSVCLADTAARLRWHEYTSERKQNRENLPIRNAILGKPKRQSLRDHNQSNPLVTRQPTSPPISPSKVRFHMFQKEARNLKENEVLMECPRCRRPLRLLSVAATRRMHIHLLSVEILHSLQNGTSPQRRVPRPRPRHAYDTHETHRINRNQAKS
ncbi:hypothetical protein GE061_011250 [Apolygus lucorum]|uniref:F-box domain-containing protein n=1 Tax=Apolygus lucorum TaxID=248454 RepID=A0A8S9XWW0_APOLU|nr:hypothetical protein GE061_011250 [Apolygus lucorum]